MNTIREHIKNGTFSTCYLLFGKDDYMIRLYKNKLVTAIVNEGDSMNFHVFRDGNADIAEVRDIAETVPFFADRRLILFENSGWFKAKQNAFASFLPEIPPTTVILFVESDVERNGELYKAVKENGYAAEFNGLSEKDLKTFVGVTLKNRGLGITDSAASYLLERVGSDMDVLSVEMEKLAAFCDGRGQVTVEDIRRITTPVTEVQLFGMADAILDNDRKKATEIYSELLQAQEKPLRILYMLTNQFFSFYKVLSMGSTGASADDIASRLGMRSFVVKKFLRRKRSWSFEKVLSAVEDGNDMERRVKSGDLEEHMAVEMFLFKYTT